MLDLVVALHPRIFNSMSARWQYLAVSEPVLDLAVALHPQFFNSMCFACWQYLAVSEPVLEQLVFFSSLCSARWQLLAVSEHVLDLVVAIHPRFFNSLYFARWQLLAVSEPVLNLVVAIHPRLFARLSSAFADRPVARRGLHVLHRPPGNGCGVPLAAQPEPAAADGPGAAALVSSVCGLVQSCAL